MVKNSFQIKNYAIVIALLCFSVVLAFNSTYSSVVLDSLSLWVLTVVPALFPYFFITALLGEINATGKLALKLSKPLNKLFNVSGICSYAFFMSVISGYPVGAKIVSDLKEKNIVSETEAERCSAFCSSSSPMFMISAVGSVMFNDKKFGLLLFLCSFLSNIIIGIIFSFYKKDIKPLNKTLPLLSGENILYDSVYSAVISILIVGGLITVFFVLTELLINLKILSPLIFILTKIFKDENIAYSITYGIFENTRGIKQLSSSPNFLSLPISALLCGFGGLCVIFQSLSHLKKAKINTTPFIIAKLLQGGICFLLGLLFSLLFY